MSRAGGTLPHGGPGGEKLEISKRFLIVDRLYFDHKILIKLWRDVNEYQLPI